MKLFTLQSLVLAAGLIVASSAEAATQLHVAGYHHVQRPAQVNVAPASASRANVRLQPGHFIDHDNGMDCQNMGGAEVCVPPNGTVHYFDPDQGLNCTRTGLVSICSNLRAFVAKKAAPKRRFEREFTSRRQAASASFSCTGPESRPLASTSRSTNSITAIGALSP
jgi:hypothetical protein